RDRDSDYRCSLLFVFDWERKNEKLFVNKMIVVQRLAGLGRVDKEWLAIFYTDRN
ncbi:MAG: hypothetical protein K0R47_5647, partial [Brevibacillus sp.]|nr:hypothetical protein [Brevibacillus sp.]